jgi:aminoglycoside phosphotransferase (APT) family kinase protein
MTAVSEAAERVEAMLAQAPARLSLSDFLAESKLRSVVVGTSKDPNAKITILLTAPQLRRVVAAVKVPTTDEAAGVVASEACMLRRLAEMAPELRTTVPRDIGTIDFHGRPGLVMTAVPGASMLTSYGRRGRGADRRVAGHFSAAGEWLARLQRATATERAPLDMDGGVAARLETRFGDDDRIGDDLERLAAIHARLARSMAPRTAVHGDFWYGNVLLENGVASGVVDWEAGEISGEPVRDLVRFSHMYALFLDRGTAPGRRVPGHPQLRAGTWGAGVEYALSGSGWFSDLVRTFLQAGLARLGAAPEGWRDAALAGIAEVAALTDHPEFARSNLELFRRLARNVRGLARRRPVELVQA